MSQRLAAFLSLPCVALLLAGGCSSEAPSCTAGESRGCACADGRGGAQSCAADGTFGPCSCLGELQDGGQAQDAGSDDAGSSDAGASDAGAADAGSTDAQWPARAEDYQASGATYLSEQTLPRKVEGVVTCCRDFDGDGVQDNAWAERMGMLSMLGLDVQTLLDQAIQSGQLAVLFDHLGAPAAPLTLAHLDARFADGIDYAQAAAGAGSFVLLPRSFLPGSGQPRDLFAATLTGGVLRASGDSFVSAVPIDEVNALLVPIRDVQIEGQQAGPLAYEGTLSGVVRLGDLYGAMNQALASPECACLRLSEPVFTTQNGRWVARCLSDAAALCPEEEQALCRRIAGANLSASETCAVQTTIWNGAPDVDSDSDGVKESISFGLRWKGVPAPTVLACVPSAGDSCQACAGDGDCAAFQPEDLCAGLMRCVESNCQVDPGTVVRCVGTVDVCSRSSCDPDTGACELEPDAENDGQECLVDRCTVGLCAQGECQQGQPLDCDDRNPCTDDRCGLEEGCFFELVEERPCDSGDLCVVSSTCRDGQCVADEALQCDDLNLCTDDWCDPARGCVFDANQAECGLGLCQPGQCIEGLCEAVAVLCFASGCQDFVCSEESGACVWSQNLPGDPVCGDGVQGCGEECDDGNLDPGDGCDAGCGRESCGDGTVQAGLGEHCDDGNNRGGDGCRFDCLGIEECGDGLVDRGEECDDGNLDDTDLCTNLCRRAPAR